MPKGHFDWFAVATLWLGAAIMAIKAGDLPLIHGMPSFFTSSIWDYLPFALVSLYGVVAFSKANVGNKALLKGHSGRVFVTADPLDLMKLCENKTQIHANHSAAPYMGKWLRYRGVVNDIVNIGNSRMMICCYYDHGRHIFIITKDTAQAEVINKGDNIEVVGKIEKIGPSDIHLNDAEITDR